MGQRPRKLDPTASVRAFFGAELRCWRERRGLSQEDLGGLVHVSGAMIGKLEKAQRRPVPDLVTLLDRALEAEGALREACTAVETQERFAGRTGRSRPESDDLSDLLTTATRVETRALLTATAEWRTWAESRIPSDRPFAPATDPTSTVIAERVRQLRRLDDASSGPQILDWTLHDLRWAQRVLGSLRGAGAGSPTTRDLHRAVSELAQLGGWVACDGGQHGLAERLWLLGLDATRAADDVRLGATIVSCLSYQALWLGDAGPATHLAVDARRGAARWPGGAFQALLATREARAHAGTGDASGCERSLADAGEWMAQSSPGEDPEWVYWVTPAVLAADAGRAWLELGHARRAAVGLTRGLQLFGDTQPRNQALHLTSLAAAYLADSEVDGAVEAVDAAVALLPTSDSRRVRQRLSGLVPGLRRSGETGSRAADRIRSVMVA
jgi:transcriptional regulator with XRE-family HTH domain